MNPILGRTSACLRVLCSSPGLRSLWNQNRFCPFCISSARLRDSCARPAAGRSRFRKHVSQPSKNGTKRRSNSQQPKTGRASSTPSARATAQAAAALAARHRRARINRMSVTKSGVGPAEFAKDLILGGSSGCLAKTICAPLERVKIVLQTAKSNDGMLRTAQSIIRDQGTTARARNLTNCARYFPTQAINLRAARYQKLLVPDRRTASRRGFYGLWRPVGLRVHL